MDSRRFIDSGVLETYVMGLATEQEAKLVVEMAARYPEVKAELMAIEDAMNEFDRRNAVQPPAHLKGKVLSKIQDSGFRIPDAQNGKSTAKVIEFQSRQNRIYKYVAAIAIVFLIGSVWTNLNQVTTIADQDDRIRFLEGQYTTLSKQVTERDSSNNVLLAQLELLKKPSMKSIELKGMEVALDAKAMAYANTSTGEVYLEIVNLPAAPEGMQYQFWGIVDGKPVDAGMIPTEGDTAGIHPMTTVPNAVAYAISLEPKGGSPQPTGKIYAMGNP